MVSTSETPPSSRAPKRKRSHSNPTSERYELRSRQTKSNSPIPSPAAERSSPKEHTAAIVSIADHYRKHRRQAKANNWPSSTRSECSPSSLCTQHARSVVLRARLKAAIRVVIQNTKRRHLTGAFARAPSAWGLESTLCKTCADLNLTRSSFLASGETWIVNSGVDSKAIRIGALEAICSRAYNCHLCRLIIRTIAQQPLDRLESIVHGLDNGNKFEDINAICFAKWENDGMVLPHRSDGRAVATPAPQTRRLCIYWSIDTFKSFHLVMMASPCHFEEPDFLGRHVGDAKDDKERLIKRWWTLCKENHDPPCEASEEKRKNFEELRRGPYFGVVDVEEMCFKALPEGKGYATLSYYWGMSRPTWFRSTRDCVLSIKERNALSQHFDKLPRTIRDTIELVRNLGLRYLWVDSLCLVTDSEDAWARNAAVMDLVYGQACLTICAADGEDAEAGLWALAQRGEPGYGQRAEQCIANYSPNLKLLARFPSERYIGESIWNSRAWTFQERLFSNRCLIFTQGRMYFECCRTTLSEDVDLESPSKGWSLDFEKSHKNGWKYATSDVVRSYMESVAQFTSKNLPVPSERLEAFEPIGKLIFDRLRGRLVYGLPNSHFDWALLWTPQNGFIRDSKQRRLPFPSWSWCGWDGEILYDVRSFMSDCMEDLHDWLTNHTWITWYIRDGSGNLRIVWDYQRHAYENHDVDQQWRGYRSNKAATHGYDFYGRQIPRDGIGLPRIEFQRALPDFPVQVRTLEPGQESSYVVSHSDDLPYLQFFTWSASFWLRPAGGQDEQKDEVVNGDDSIALRRYYILDAEQRWAGEITLSSRWRFDGDRPHPFIALSEAKYFAREPDESEVVDDDTYANMVESSDTADKSWKLYNVLLLDYQRSEKSTGDWRYNKVAYRVGLGRVYKKAFENGVAAEGHAGKKWREVILG